MSRLPVRRVLLITLVVALLAFFLPPFINANRFRAHIAATLGQALGRQVTIDQVGVHLLPQPGFDLRNLVVSDAPAFGVEPVLRADEVSASLRLSSLWRGRLEIASLSLKYPSLNLARSAGGQWNVESLLERAAQTPTAPTAKPRAEARPRFPYIQAESGRINLKLGQEKTVYSLTEADFALWLASENEWRMRLSARPMRTDINISDTGIVKVSGKFQRASHLHDTPLELSAFLTGAQLGQLTKVVYGRDRGWRGAVEIDAVLSGTPANLTITAHAGVNDFRRYDIGTVEKLRLDARCTAHYSTVSKQVSKMNCQLPMGNGVVTARGVIDGLPRPRTYDLSFAGQHVPMQTLVTLARHAKKDIPDDLKAGGSLDAAFTLRKSDPNKGALWSGGGSTSEVELRSSVLATELPLGSLQFAVEGPGTEQFAKAAQLTNVRRRRSVPLPPAQMRLSFAPFAVSLGGAAPVNVRAWFSGSEYDFDIIGDARIVRALQVARAVGLRVPRAAIDGSAKLDFSVTGSWTGFAGPVPVGKAQLRSVTSPIPGFAARLQLASATLVLAPDKVSVTDMDGSFGGLDLDFTGQVHMARGCDALERCPVQFDLRATQLSTDDLNRLLNPSFAKRAWYDMFGGRTETPVLAKVQAKGRMSANRVLIKSVALNRVTAAVELQKGTLALTAVTGDVFGGKYRADWRAEFTGPEPVYIGTGTFDSVAMAQLATLMRDNWASGMVTAQHRVTMNGWTASELLASAAATANFKWRNGILRHVSLDVPIVRSGPLQFREFAGTAELRDGAIKISDSKMATPTGIYQISGTASLGRQVNLKLRNGRRAYSVSGTLAAPKVAALNEVETQTELKPQ